MNFLMLLLLFQGPVSDGQLLEHTPYQFPFESHQDWLKVMNGKGLDDWSEIIDRADFERFQSQKTVLCQKIVYSSDGLKINGYLLTPRNQEKPVPAIIFNRGGAAKWARITFWEILEMHRLAEKGYDPVYGARPLKRFIQQHLETPISRKIIAGALSEGAVLEVSVKGGQLAV